MNGLIAVANAPGVYQAIKAGISSVLNGMMVLPKRIDIPLTDEITNEIRFRFVFNQSEIVLTSYQNSGLSREYFLNRVPQSEISRRSSSRARLWSFQIGNGF